MDEWLVACLVGCMEAIFPYFPAANVVEVVFGFVVVPLKRQQINKTNKRRRDGVSIKTDCLVEPPTKKKSTKKSFKKDSKFLTKKGFLECNNSNTRRTCSTFNCCCMLLIVVVVFSFIFLKKKLKF